VIGREKCIHPTTMIMSNVHARKSFFFAPYRPNSPNKILELGSSIIVKMMDERCSDLLRTFPNFISYVLYSIKYILFYHHTTTTVDFLFSNGRFVCCPNSLCSTKSLGLVFFIHPSCQLLFCSWFFFSQKYSLCRCR